LTRRAASTQIDTVRKKISEDVCVPSADLVTKPTAAVPPEEIADLVSRGLA
jgi:hypothetical protein